MEQTEKEFLKSYDKNKYEKPSVTIDIIVISTDESFSALRVLLIKRKKHPCRTLHKKSLPNTADSFNVNYVY